MLKFTRSNRLIEILQVKYLNNIIEQDHRFIKKITRPMLGFKAFHSASATLKGIEVSHMVRGVVARIGCQVLTQAFATTTDMLNAAAIGQREISLGER